MARRRSVARWLWYTLAAVAVVIGTLFASSAYVDSVTQQQMFTVASAPYRKVGLVLGTSRRTTYRLMNGYYYERMRTAAELYASGKVQYLLVSGDNGTLEYNEPDSMRRDLVAMGVPENRIALDFAGFDTYDSMVRANKVWGVDSLLVVSQDFQVRRAVYIASHRGIAAAGVIAHNPYDASLSITKLRELFARIKMLAEVHVLNSQPKFLGPRESFPVDSTGT